MIKLPYININAEVGEFYAKKQIVYKLFIIFLFACSLGLNLPLHGRFKKGVCLQNEKSKSFDLIQTVETKSTSCEVLLVSAQVDKNIS